MKRPRWPVLALAAIVVCAVAVLVTAALQNSVVYYRTPTEVLQSSESVGRTVRLGGEVMPGSLRVNGERTEFALGDGHSTMLVVTTGALPDTFRERQGAVVEGLVLPGGRLRAGTIAVKHSNEYRPPDPRAAEAEQ
jgi:cytochrome c-type biogenesis protein CcmE